MADNSGDFSFESYERFLDFVDEKGLMGRATAQGLKVAASKVKEHLTKAELDDVREINAEAAFRKLVNKGEKLRPSTLKEYIRRMDRGVAEFSKWRQSPAEYQPKSPPTRSNGGSAKKPVGKKSPPEVDPGSAASSAHAPTSRPRSAGQEGGISIPFPLRGDFVVHIEVPRDLRLSEARRLSAFMETLAMDFEAGT